MLDATARIEPNLLAAVLRDVEGVTLDPSTEEGVQAAAQIVDRMMADPESAARLLQAVERHADAALRAGPPFPTAYGPAACAEVTLPHDPSLDVPPVGSEEFSAYMEATAEEPVEDVDEAVIAAMPLAKPSELGFRAEAAEPPPRSYVDATLEDAQRLLEVKLRSPFRSLRAALGFLMRRGENDLDVLALPRARNRFVVHLKGENVRWRWDSIAAGDFLYVRMMADGKLAFKARLSLSDKAATKQRLEAAFANEPLAGARLVRALRMAMLEVDADS